MKKTKWLMSIGLLVLLGGVIGAEPIDKTPTDRGSLVKLKAEGRQIVTADAEKKPVVLRGVVFTSGVWFYTNENPSAASLANVRFMQSEADIRRISRWGANVITFYMNYYWFENEEGYQFMDQVLDWCRRANVYIIPSLTVYPIGGLRGGREFFASPEARDQLNRFWAQFANRYRGRPEIAGYDILNEPMGTSVSDIVDYQQKLIDTIRKADPETIIFIEPMWGNPKDFKIIRRPNLVYNAHYYEPFYFTSQGWPWMYSGGVPTGLSYPDTQGEMIAELKPTNGKNGSYLPLIRPGTYDWQPYTVTEKAPPKTEYAYLKLFSNGDSGATLWFDQVEYSIDGSPYQLLPNGSFEERNPVSNDPLLWEQYQAGKGFLYRTDALAKDGKYSICIQNPSGWSHFGNYHEYGWLGTLSAIRIAPGQKLSIRFWVKGKNVSANKNGLILYFCRAQKEVYTKAEMERDMKRLLISFSERNNIPIFIGEFTPPIQGKRPDIIDYICDAVGYWNDRHISWTFYHYRDVGEWYMGIYNGPMGVPTEKCREDTELRKTLQGLFIY